MLVLLESHRETQDDNCEEDLEIVRRCRCTHICRIRRRKGDKDGKGEE